jgi:fumarate reductase subunit C
MKAFVSMVIVVLILTLFAVENTTPVSMKFASFSVAVPLSLAIIMPLGIALLLFALFYFSTTRKADLVIRNLEDSVEDAQKQALEATKRTHELEIENRKQKIRLGEETDADDRSL